MRPPGRGPVPVHRQAGATPFSTGSGAPGLLRSPVLFHWAVGSDPLPTSLERTHLMTAPTTDRAGALYDATPDFVYADGLLKTLA